MEKQIKICSSKILMNTGSSICVTVFCSKISEVPIMKCYLLFVCLYVLTCRQKWQRLYSETSVDLATCKRFFWFLSASFGSQEQLN